MSNLITIAVLEDEKNFRDSVVELINSTDDMKCIAKFDNVTSFYANFKDIHPDIFWVDLHLPDGSGIDVIKYIKKEREEALCLVCSFFDSDEKVFTALRGGADGYLLKGENIETILKSISELISGGAPMSPSIARKILATFKPVCISGEEFDLTLREKEILGFLSKGLLYKNIAINLYISPETVKKHIRNIYTKLQVTNKVEAINKYFEK